ncbi:7TM diverse intracellular signaling domain-containing protein [Tellurirhabdus rosea]|uniref:7TM diverse intracellular signaling domain-containing protein n=1 Tax=Tellurirhabdus rosea TaxID=2674997 RepID=UPI002252A529|nr:7TM diverse intracellular signaling domain-containing protein [Tellurirhabdus rosea]
MLRISNTAELVQIGQYIQYYEDRTNQLTYREIARLPESKFVKSEDNIINLGYSSSRIWLKISLQNLTSEALYAFIEAQEVDYIDAYVVGQDTTYFLETGALRPFANRNFAINSVVLNLGKKPQYLFLGFRDMNGLVLPVKIGAIQPIVQKVYRETMINFTVIGIMVLIAVFSFFLYSSLGDPTYGWYALHVIFSALTMMTFEGYLFDFFWQEMPYMNNGINSSLIRLLTLLSSIVFSVAFLNLREILPKTIYFYRAMAFLGALIVGAKILGVQQAEAAFNITVLVTFLSFLGVGIWLYRKGFRAARFYLLGWGIYIVEILLLVLTLFNVLSFDHFFTYYGYQIGAVFQATLLTFALLERINELRSEAREAQELALRRLQENEQLVARQNQILEKELEEPRPSTNSELKDILKALREEREKSRKIPIATMEGVLLFSVNDILRIEAMGSYANVYFVNQQKLMASRSLAEFEQQLQEHDNFFKTHKSHIVNVNYITKYIRGEGGVVMLSDGSEVDVARRVKPEFLRKMGLDN